MSTEKVSILPAPVSPLWRAELTAAAAIKPTAIRWLWPGWLPRGKLAILAGAGGSGKTTLVIGLIGTLSSGGVWPDGERCAERGNSIIWSSEDDPADTLVPRLIAAGADLSKVHFVEGRINGLGEREPFDPARDFDLLKEAVLSIGSVSLLLLDPIVNLVRGDMNQPNQVRRSLQALVDFADAQGCAVIGISHFSKGSGASAPTERVIGSQAFGALARVVLVAAKQEHTEARVLARAKSNIGSDDGGVSYVIEQCTIAEGIETTRISWGDLVEGSARDILAEAERLEGESEPDADDPVEALRRILSSGAMTGKEAKNLMKGEGYTEKQIRRAREKLEISVRREGFGKDISSYWSLPALAPDYLFMPSDSHSCPHLGVGMNEEKGHEWGDPAPLDDDAEAF